MIDFNTAKFAHVEYDSITQCVRCKCNMNEVTVAGRDCGHISEAHTRCEHCGWRDYWAYGFFESKSDPLK